MTRVFRAAVTLAVLALWPGAGIVPAGPALAETVQVRSGEHPGFSRLVIRPESATGWALGRSGGGYELRLDRAGIVLDVARIFDLIPRDRISAVGVAADGVTLRIEVSADHHAKAFETSTGAIVIDVAAGPPPEASPFEAALPEPAASAGGAVTPDDAAGVAPQTTATEAAAHPAAGEAGLNAAASVPTAPGLFAANGGLALGNGAAPGAGAPMATAGGVAFLPAATPQVSYRPAPDADPRLALYWHATPAPGTAPIPASANHTAPEPAAPESAAPAAHAEASLESRHEMPALPPAFDSRVAAIEMELLMQLGRAAAQGLIEPAPASRNSPAPLHGSTAGAAPEVAHAAPAPEEGGPGGAETAATVPVAGAPTGVHAETSIDRELADRPRRAPVNAEGDACLSDEATGLASWGDERPYVIQMGEANLGLVGEFDIADPDGVARLARLYLYFGFGAEAKAALSAFGTAPEDMPVLLELAAILDASPPPEANAFAGMEDCDTGAALWAVLSQPALTPGTTVNRGAVLRGFSGLPLHLRRQLGVPLVNRFLGAGDGDTARAVRDAIARAPGEHGSAVSMIDAELDMARGDVKSAETLLAGVAAEDGAHSARAVVLAIQSRLDRGAAVEASLAASAGALAFERRKAPDGPALARAHVLGLASAGEFDEAFLALGRWRAEVTTALQRETTIELFSLLAQPEAEPFFLAKYFDHRALIDVAIAPNGLRMTLAEKLLGHGFTDEARRLAGPEAGETESGRLFLARAAMAEFDPLAALRHVAGLDGQMAMRLRGDALAALGRHQDAALAYLAVTEPEAAGGEAWRAGDWTRVADLGSKAQRGVVAALRLTADPTALPAPGVDAMAAAITDGTLAADRALLEESRAARAALEALFGETRPFAEQAAEAGS